MDEGVDFRQFVYKVAVTTQSDKKNWLKLRETLGTAILGTLSASVSVVVSIIGVMAILKLRGVDLNRELFSYPQLWLATVAAISGWMMGVSGLALGRIRWGTISPFCAVGTIASLIAMVLIAYNRN